MNSIRQNFSSEFQWDDQDDQIKFYENQIKACEEKIRIGEQKIQFLENNINHKRKFDQNLLYPFVSKVIENDTALGNNFLVMKQIEKLEHEKKVLGLDSKNRILLKVKNKNIKTNLPVESFLMKVQKASELDKNSESDFWNVEELYFKKKQRIIFHKKNSGKVSFYFDDINSQLAVTEKSLIRKITKMALLHNSSEDHKIKN